MRSGDDLADVDFAHAHGQELEEGDRGLGHEGLEPEAEELGDEEEDDEDDGDGDEEGDPEEGLRGGLGEGGWWEGHGGPFRDGWRAGGLRLGLGLGL